jgi:hypothetical protein
VPALKVTGTKVASWNGTYILKTWDAAGQAKFVQSLFGTDA